MSIQLLGRSNELLQDKVSMNSLVDGSGSTLNEGIVAPTHFSEVPKRVLVQKEERGMDPKSHVHPF